MAETFLIIHFVSLEMTETFINGSVRFFLDISIYMDESPAFYLRKMWRL